MRTTFNRTGRSSPTLSTDGRECRQSSPRCECVALSHSVDGWRGAADEPVSEQDLPPFEIVEDDSKEKFSDNVHIRESRVRTRRWTDACCLQVPRKHCYGLHCLYRNNNYSP